MFRSIAILLLAASLATGVGCSHAPSHPAPAALAIPALRLPPSALPEPLALQQRLSFRRGDKHDTVDALVESDGTQTRLVIHAMGQVALRLDWDGHELHQQRASWLPSVLDGERVLTDLQLVFWPVPAISAALPQGWSLTEEGGRRVLRRGHEVVASVDYPEALHARLEQHALGYTLDIQSSPISP